MKVEFYDFSLISLTKYENIICTLTHRWPDIKMNGKNEGKKARQTDFIQSPCVKPEIG